MNVVRQPLAATVSNRSASLGKDALLLNCYAELQGETPHVLRRFGYHRVAAYGTNPGLGLFAYNGQTVSVVGTTARLGNVVLGTVDGTSQYQFTTTGANTGFFLKNNSAAYIYDGSTLARLTDSDYPATTVPGVVYLAGFVFVMTPAGRVYSCGVNTPAAWNALDYISTQSSDAGVAVAKYLQYVVGFGENSLTFFYNNANPAGSPLLPQENATQNIGCANGQSVVQTKNTVFFVGQTRQRGRSVYMLNGATPQSISDPFIDRLLAADDLSTVFAYFIELNGHQFYVLTLKTSNLTLVFDALTNAWCVWSTAKPGTTLNATAAVVAGNTIQLTIPNHRLKNGQIGVLETAGPYKGMTIINVVDANTISFVPTATAPLDGIDTNPLNGETINDNA